MNATVFPPILEQVTVLHNITAAFNPVFSLYDSEPKVRKSLQYYMFNTDKNKVPPVVGKGKGLEENGTFSPI